MWGEPEDCKSIRDHENVDEFDENIKMSMMPSYGKLVAKDPEAENYQPPVLDHSNIIMMDINFYSASEDGIICSMAGYCWLLNPCPCDIVHILLTLA